MPEENFKTGSGIHIFRFKSLKGFKVLCPGGMLDISLGGEVRPGPSYPDPV